MGISSWWQCEKYLAFYPPPSGQRINSRKWTILLTEAICSRSNVGRGDCAKEIMKKNWGCACISGTTASEVRVIDVIPNSNVILSVKTRQIKVDRKWERLKTMTQMRGEKKWARAARGGKKRERGRKWNRRKWKEARRAAMKEGRAKTQIRDNQAWGSCAKFTAVIWNPTALASGWRERHNRLSFARNSPCLVGVSVTASFSPPPPPPPPPPPLSILHGAQMKLASWDRQHISSIPDQPALKTHRREGSFQLWRAKRENVNW